MDNRCLTFRPLSARIVSEQHGSRRARQQCCKGSSEPMQSLLKSRQTVCPRGAQVPLALRRTVGNWSQAYSYGVFTFFC